MRYGFLVLFPVLALSACALMTKGHYQHVSVNTFYRGQQIEGAHCTLKNDKGTWHVLSQGSADIRRSRKPLVVTCVKSGYDDATLTSESADEQGVWADRLAGGIVGTIIDNNNATDQDYQSVITVEMGQKQIIQKTPLEGRGVEK